jgi:soluble lytic murein transglycosylase-like protein
LRKTFIMAGAVAGFATLVAGAAQAGDRDELYKTIRDQHATMEANGLITGSLVPLEKKDQPGAQKKVADAKDGEAGYVKKGKALGYASDQRGRYRDLIAKHASANGIPFALADAVVRIESRYNPRAHNGGAVGLMQIKPQTARGLGYSGGAAGLMNPETNLIYGIKYLAQAYRMSGGDVCGTVMRYQSGHYATRMNGANKAYCSKVRTIQASL